MARVAAIGEAVRLEGFTLAGVLVLPGERPAQVRASWHDLPADVEVVILTPRARAALGTPRTGPLTVVMPQ
jgi:vacuolar-type H+-ATPase subunit F/Vma7